MDGPPEHPFFGPRSKLARAQKILAEYKDLEADYKDAASWFVGRYTDHSGMVHHYVKVGQPIPADMSHAAAEVTYHLRSALDQMVCAIARANGRNDTRSVYFPFVERESDFEGKGATQKMRGLPQAVRDLILKLRPWKGGSDDLWGLGKLANVDKHNLLIPFGALGGATGIGGIEFDGKNVASLTMNGRMGNLLEGVVFATHEEGGVFKFWPNSQLTVGAKIVFSESVPIFSGKEPAPTFENLIELCSGIVETFAAHCFGK